MNTTQIILGQKMSKTIALVSLLAVLVLIFSSVSARPAQSLSRQKRQSDQRIAELETLLALQKYGRHRFRADHKKGVGANGEHQAGYGLFDFRILGRKKKSTRFFPGELAISSVKDVSRDHPPSYQEQESFASPEENNYPEQLSYQETTRQGEAVAVPVLYIEKK